MRKALRISAAIALTMSVASCGTARSVSQGSNTQQAEKQPASDTLSNHGTPMPEGFIRIADHFVGVLLSRERTEGLDIDD